MAKNLELSYLLDFYGDVLTEKQRDVMEQYYNDDLSLAEIAENFGITRQGVRDSIKRGEGILLELEEKVGFARRTRNIRRQLALLEDLARGVEYTNNTGYARNPKIADDISKMRHVIAELSEGDYDGL